MAYWKKWQDVHCSNNTTLAVYTAAGYLAAGRREGRDKLRRVTARAGRNRRGEA
jgi:hypothetical protein